MRFANAEQELFRMRTFLLHIRRKNNALHDQKQENRLRRSTAALQQVFPSGFGSRAARALRRDEARDAAPRQGSRPMAFSPSARIRHVQGGNHRQARVLPPAGPGLSRRTDPKNVEIPAAGATHSAHSKSSARENPYEGTAVEHFLIEIASFHAKRC